MSPENEVLAALLGYSHNAVKRVHGAIYDFDYPIACWLCEDIRDCGHCLRDIVPVLRKRGLAFECGVDSYAQAWGCGCGLRRRKSEFKFIQRLEVNK